MCTLTWRSTLAGYELYFNRDELRHRAAALGPRLHMRHNVDFIAPADADAGGTWIGVNAFGLTLCLLNHYPDNAAPMTGGYHSRGHLIPALIASRNQEEALARLQAMDLARYRPFTLTALAPGTPLACSRWHGSRRLECLAAASPPLCSSSFATDQVIASRQDLFPAYHHNLAAYHASHKPQAGPFSVCMHRPDAHTVSSTRITLHADHIACRYIPGSPCSTAPLAPVQLQRRTDQTASLC